MSDQQIKESKKLLFQFYKERYSYELSEKNRYISLMQNPAIILISLSAYSVFLFNNLAEIVDKYYSLYLFFVIEYNLFLVVGIYFFFQFWMARGYRHIPPNKDIEKHYSDYVEYLRKEERIEDPYVEMYDYLYDEYRESSDQNQEVNRLKNRFYVSLRIMMVPLVVSGLFAYIFYVIGS